jgi:hypothetical protein
VGYRSSRKGAWRRRLERVAFWIAAADQADDNLLQKIRNLVKIAPWEILPFPSAKTAGSHSGARLLQRKEPEKKVFRA